MINWIFSRFTKSPPLNTVQLLEWYFSLPEIEEYQKFKIPKRQTEWLASRLLVKQLVLKVISSEKPSSLRSITFHKESSGVPFIEVEGFERVGWLSISHSAEGVFAAFSLEDLPRFGVDLEFIEPRPLDLFADYFTPSEITWIAASPKEKQDLYANLVWSAKEAFLKAIEIGLHMDTRKINIHPYSESFLFKGWNRIGFTVEGINSQGLQILFSQQHGYVMTVCLSEGQKLQFVKVPELSSL